MYLFYHILSENARVALESECTSINYIICIFNYIIFYKMIKLTLTNDIIKYIIKMKNNFKIKKVII